MVPPACLWETKNLCTLQVYNIFLRLVLWKLNRFLTFVMQNMKSLL